MVYTVSVYKVNVYHTGQRSTLPCEVKGTPLPIIFHVVTPIKQVCRSKWGGVS